jgi:hypothetical protein
MKRSQLVAFVAIGLLATFVLYLAVRGRQAPVLPADRHHAFVDADSCRTCHSLDDPVMQKIDHTPRRDCLQCHAIP